jgi:hypothetical protein
MNRRNIFKAITGLFAAKSLPAAPVKVPASLQVAKAAAATNPVFAGGCLELHGIGWMDWMKEYEEAEASERGNTND